MKTRCAAALMLTGWYLMVPPLGYNGNQTILSGWVVLHSYDTARECEAVREKMNQEAASREAASRSPIPPPPPGSLPINSPACFASDDPRLKSPFEVHVP
jgi:hypothetical protein